MQADFSRWKALSGHKNQKNEFNIFSLIKVRRFYFLIPRRSKFGRVQDNSQLTYLSHCLSNENKI